MKPRCLFFAVSLLVINIVACFPYSTNIDVEQNTIVDIPREHVTIGFALGTLLEERWQRDLHYFSARVRELGGELVVQNANNNHESQMKQVEFLLEQGVDVLVIVPYDLNRAAHAVELAKRMGVKVISYDRLIRNADLDLYISFDNVKVGELMAEYVLKKIPTGKYVIINGAPTDNNAHLINHGIKSVLHEPMGNGDIEIIFEGWAEDWLAEQAYSHIQTLLAQGEAFDAVIAGNDSLSSAVIEALSEWRLAGQVVVTGQDADLAGCQRIAEGTLHMTVYKPIKQIAYRAAELAMALGAGGEIVTNYPLISNDQYLVPAEIITPIPIDRHLLSVVIADGFHSKEDIYMNVPISDWPEQ